MKDILKPFDSVIENFNSRLKNPFIFSFIIAWIVTNWKAISYFLYSNLDIEHRIYHIESNYSGLRNTFWFPMFVATFYVLVFPIFLLIIDFLSSYVYELRQDLLYKSKKKQITREVDLIIHKTEREDKKAEYKDISQFNEEINNYREEINRKNDTIDRLLKDLSENRSELENVKESLDINQNAEILHNKFRNNKIYKDFELIVSSIGQNGDLPVFLEPSDVEYLIAVGLIERYKQDNKNKYKLTRVGNHVWYTHVAKKFSGK